MKGDTSLQSYIYHGLDWSFIQEIEEARVSTPYNRLRRAQIFLKKRNCLFHDILLAFYEDSHLWKHAYHYKNIVMTFRIDDSLNKSMEMCSVAMLRQTGWLYYSSFYLRTLRSGKAYIIFLRIWTHLSALITNRHIFIYSITSFFPWTFLPL